MQSFGIFLGLAGLVFLIISPGLGVGLIILGGLFAIVGARQNQRADEEDRLAEEAERHQQLVAAMASRGSAAGTAALPDPFEEGSLKRASDLIRDAKYPEARALLQTMTANAQAQEWLKRLDDPKYQ